MSNDLLNYAMFRAARKFAGNSGEKDNVFNLTCLSDVLTDLADLKKGTVIDGKILRLLLIGRDDVVQHLLSTNSKSDDYWRYYLINDMAQAIGQTLKCDKPDEIVICPMCKQPMSLKAINVPSSDESQGSFQYKLKCPVCRTTCSVPAGQNCSVCGRYMYPVEDVAPGQTKYKCCKCGSSVIISEHEMVINHAVGK